MHSWKMVDPLIGFHAVELVALHSSVLPINVPVFLIVVSDLEVVHFGARPDDGVVAVADVDDQPLISVLELAFLLLFLFFWRLLVIQILSLLIIYYCNFLGFYCPMQFQIRSASHFLALFLSCRG
jgi:hypothetical protein